MDFKKSFHHGDKVAPDPSGEVFDKLAKYLLLMHNWNKQPVTRTRTATARARASKNYKDLTENVGSTEKHSFVESNPAPAEYNCNQVLSDLNLITKLIKSSTNFGTEIILDSMHLQYEYECLKDHSEFVQLLI